MGLLDFLTRKSKPLQPEAAWRVDLTADAINVTDHTGKVRSVARNSLSGILIETNDSGPWGADVWWLMFDADDKMACAFPQGATGEKFAIDYFTQLEGFDSGAMISAMASTSNAAFPVWRPSSD